MADCPKLQKKKYKEYKGKEKKKEKKEKKAFKATWDDSSSESSSSDSEDELKANLCLVAKESGEESSSNPDEMVTSLNPSYDELSCVYDELCEAYETLLHKHKHSKKEVSRLSKIEKLHLNECCELNAKHVELNVKYDDACYSLDVLTKENEELKAKLNMHASNSNVTACFSSSNHDLDALYSKVHDLEEKLANCDEHECIMLQNTSSLQTELDCAKEKYRLLELQFSKFSMSSSKLNDLLASQRHYLDKSGLGYDPMKLKESLGLEAAMAKPSKGKAKLGYENGSTSSSKGIPSKKRKVHLKKVWVPKGLCEIDKKAYVLKVFKIHAYTFVTTNPQGSKIWIPKVH